MACRLQVIIKFTIFIPANLFTARVKLTGEIISKVNNQYYCLIHNDETVCAIGTFVHNIAL